MFLLRSIFLCYNFFIATGSFMDELDLKNSKDPKIKPRVKTLNEKASKKLLHVAGVGQNGSNTTGNEGIYINSDFYRNDVTGKPYPGRVNFNTQRVLAYNSTVVRAILTLRSHQIAKLPIQIVPSNKNEPPRQMHVLDYNIYQIDNHPAFDEPEQ